MLAYNKDRSATRYRADDSDAGTTDGGPTETRVELWHEPIYTGNRNEFDRVVDRLYTLADRGYVDAVAVETWERYVDASGGPPEDDASRSTLDRLGRLDQWAWRHGGGHSPVGESRPASRGRLGPPIDARRVPRAALVEFENGVVTHVTFADERTGCLTERLRRIGERERSETESSHDDPVLTRE